MSLATLTSAAECVQLETIKACPVCSSEDHLELYETHDWLYGLSGEFKLSRCNDCGVIYLSERPTRQSIGFYYPFDSYYSYVRPASYSLFWRRDIVSSFWYFVKKSILAHQYNYKHLGGSKSVSLLARAHFMRPLRTRATFQLDVLLHPYIRGGSLLEVGCGSGMYLDLMRGLGWSRVVGVDISARAIQQAKEVLGIEAYCGNLEDAPFEASSFDAVSLSHTLEHMPEPMAFLREVNRVMKSGGRIAVIVPNIDSRGARKFGAHWFHLDSPRHTVNFSRGSLRLALERAGFRVESLKTNPRGAYQTALLSYCRKAGDDHSIHTAAKPGYPLNRRAQALFLSLIERIECVIGLQTGEEILAVARKPR